MKLCKNIAYILKTLFCVPSNNQKFYTYLWSSHHLGQKQEISSGGGSTESQYLSKSTNTQRNIYFSKSRRNTM